jgi:hypothetical protein
MIKKYFKLILLLILTVGCSAQKINKPKTIFVSPNGNNDNTGLTINEPFSTINKAVENAAPGDTVFLLPGKYKEVINFSSKKGEAEEPICVLGYSNNKDNYPVIDGGAVKPSDSAENYWMVFDNACWIEVGRIKFINGWRDPIQINNSSFITFDGCMFWGARHVIWAKGELTHNMLVENCFWDQGGEFLWKLVSDSTGADAWTSMHHKNLQYFNGSIIDFRGTGGDVVIRNNTIINSFNAIRWRGQDGGYDSNVEIYDNNISQVRDNDFEPETYAYNLYIYHNFSHNIHRTLSVDHVNGGYIYYYGNVITTDNDPWTVKVCNSFWKIYGSTGRNLNYPLYLFNNSLYGCAYAFKTDVGESIQTKHFNNAYYFSLDNGWIVNKWDSTDAFDYDISNKKWPENFDRYNQEAHGKIADIKYIDPLAGNLKLQKDSPGIDAGKVMSFPELGWTQTYYGKAPDVGAYENGNLVEGPPFRFRIPPGMKLAYKEKPRIVRYKIEGKNLLLFFSDKIDNSTIDKNKMNIFKNKAKVNIESVSLTEDNYEIYIQTRNELSENGLSISFTELPYDLNGEQSTYWASVIKIHKLQNNYNK